MARTSLPLSTLLALALAAPLAAQAGQDEAFTYSPLGLRDPFQPLLTGAARREVEQVYRLVGLAWDAEAQVWQALVVDTEGASRVLRQGDWLPDLSQVTEISDGQLVRTWEYQDLEGTRLRRQETLLLRAE